MPSEQILKILADSSPFCFALFDNQVRYLLASRKWKEEFGLESMDLIGRSHYDVFPEIPERWKHVHQLGLKGKTIRKEDDCFIRENGQYYYLSWQVIPWYLSDGKVGGILMLSENLNFYKKVEQEFRNLNDSLEYVLKISRFDLRKISLK